MNDIRSQLNRAAGPEEPPIDLARLRRQVRSRRQRRQAALAGIGALAVIAFGAISWASEGQDQQLTTSQGPGDASSTSAPPEQITTSTQVSTTTTEPSSETTDLAPPAPSVPATTSTVPAPTSTAPATSTPVVPSTGTSLPATAGAVEVVGTHRGEGLPYEPSPGGCAMFAHRIDGVFALATGEEWIYDADYCGTVDGDYIWSGAGAFTLTTPMGDTLTGTFTSRAALPTKGEPYDLTIGGGSGAWAEASGTCHLTNHIQLLPSGMQEQAGTFTCSIARADQSLG